MLTNKLMGKTGEDKQFIEDLFAVHLYTGTGSAQTITNGIDLAGKGGMVWIKGRSATDNALYDTTRGATYDLVSNSTTAQTTQSTGLTAFTTTGFSIGALAKLNTSAATYASWTFRKAPKFFDVVTYTGNGVAGRTISHSLGQAPGMIIVKSVTDSNWIVWHRSGTQNQAYAAWLNRSSGYNNYVTDYWGSVSMTASGFTVGTNADVNANGTSYVAYLFAHDTTTDGLIQCGSFTTDASGNATVNLGREPQYVMFKASSTTGNWITVDNMRGIPVGSADAQLYPNLNNAEAYAATLDPTATGFNATTLTASVTYIYMAIRRGPMRTPTDGTKVFQPNANSGVITTGFPVDLNWIGFRSGGSNNVAARERLVGAPYLSTSSTAAETGTTDIGFDSNTGLTYSMSSGWINWNFRRAPGFFDVVCYTGTGSMQSINHNLGVAPELVISKCRDSTGYWFVDRPNNLSNYNQGILNTTSAFYDNWLPSGYPATATTFRPPQITSGATYVAYLFASCPGVSKVFSFTGNGSSQTINCGFANGARFVLIKRTDSTGDWYVWDTARGIVAGNDPHLSLNTTTAEVTTDDTIDPASTGFIVNQVAATSVNVNGASYIGLAIA